VDREETHHRPQHALKLIEQVDVLRLESVLPDELGELSEVPLVLQDLAALFRLGELAVEVRRDGAVEDAA
jgi:hypothetical protein